MSLKVERKENKVYITYKDLEIEIEPDPINVEVEVKKFDECVKRLKEKGIENPDLNTIIKFALLGEDIEC